MSVAASVLMNDSRSSPSTPDGDHRSTTPTSRTQGHRYSSFDTKLFSSYTRGSPSQAKRALEAHIADTDRRIQDASRLGTTLLEQKKELAARLKDVEQVQDSNEVGPELKQRLIELEREYNDIGRESARAFLPKPRRPGADARDVDGVASTSSGDGRPAPDRVQVPLAKQRNQPGGRIHDIEFATEISTSLLAQVRHLQGILAEKEESLKKIQIDKSRMQAEVEECRRRLRGMELNEQEYKDENYKLDIQVHDLKGQVTEVVAKKEELMNEFRTAQNKNLRIEEECERALHRVDELSSELETMRRDHAIALSSHRRELSSENEKRKASEQRIEELERQYHELGDHVKYRMGQENGYEEPVEDLGTETRNLEHITPDHSPPPSPTKATPRHSALESETLKSSLHHAHRMIQNLKSSINRERTEKVELKRLLQDARDELEVRRNDNGTAAANAGRKRKPNPQLDAFKVPPRPSKLGRATGLREEIVNDPSWEEYDESPGRGGYFGKGDAYDLGMNSGDRESEKEINGDGLVHQQNAASSVANGEQKPRESTDLSEPDEYDLTPDSQKYRWRLNRGGYTKSHTILDGNGSPASFTTNQSQTRGGQNLAAELDDVGGNYASVMDGTPNRSIASQYSTPDMPRKRSTIVHSPISGTFVQESFMADSPQVVVPSLAQWQKEQAEKASRNTTAGMESKQMEPFSAQVPGQPTTEAYPEAKEDYHSSSRVTPPVVPFQMSSILSQTIAPSQPKISSSSGLFRPAVPMVRTLDHNLPDAATPVAPKHEAKSPVSSHTLALASAIVSSHSRGTKYQTENSPALTSPFPSFPESGNMDDAASSGSAITTGGLLEQPRAREDDTDQRRAFGVTVGHQEHPSVLEESAEASFDSARVRASETVQFLDASEMQTSVASSNASYGPDPFSSSLPNRELHSATEMATNTGTDPLLSSITLTVPRGSRNIVDENSSINEPSLRIARTENRGGSFEEPTLQLEDPYTPSPSSIDMPNNRGFGLRSLQGNQASVGKLSGPKSISPSEIISRNWTSSMTDEGTQTLVSADQIENLLKERNRRNTMSTSVPPFVSPSSSRAHPSSRVMSMGSRSSDQINVVEQPMFKSPSRPGSAGGIRKGTTASQGPAVPPLPADHKEVIAAAASRSSSMVGNMVPPVLPSASRSPMPQLRSRTSSGTIHVIPMKLPNTPRNRSSSLVGRSEVVSPSGRRSSVSSFTSEVEERFKISSTDVANNQTIDGFDVSNTDPRMIQAITQTMIGEFLWKYTRKAGRGEHSGNRHKRFFWIHPYTRTLYWSNQDPSAAGSKELRAKSVGIEAVRVVSDDNPIPPGLHQKSIVVVTPGRSIKFTALTSKRHETWFNALSYLLLRNSTDREEELAQQVQQYNYLSNDASSINERTHTMTSYNDRSNTMTTINDRSNTMTSINGRSNTMTSNNERSNTMTSINSDDMAEFNPGYPSRSQSRVAVSSRRSTASLGVKQHVQTGSRSHPRRAPSPQNSSQMPSLAVRQSQAAQKRGPSPTFSRPDPVVGSSTEGDHFRPGSRSALGHRDDMLVEEPQQKKQRPISMSVESMKSQGGLRSLTSRIMPPSSFFGRRNRNKVAEGWSTPSRGKERMSADTTSYVSSIYGDSIASHGRGPALENVRACCDGKHDVGSLHHRSRHASLNSRTGHAIPTVSSKHDFIDGGVD